MDKKVLSRKEAVQILVQYQLNKLSKQERMWILENWWETDEDDPEFFQLPSDLQTEIKEYDSPAEPLLIKYDRLLLIALTDSLSGVKNTYLKNQLAQFGIKVDEIKGNPIDLYECPCCSYKNLPVRGEYFICSVCFWEDDGSNDPEHYSGPNHMTLKEAQDNFSQFGACTEDSLKSISPDAKEKYAKG
jgi:hypothetical protein